MKPRLQVNDVQRSVRMPKTLQRRVQREANALSKRTGVRISFNQALRTLLWRGLQRS